ncbi:ABC transporter substrate-binding protein [Rhizobium sp. RU36D]|uniref:ABC transporter substrate-binding protein n=1 Tax=Rhizobium sp. RU36D TaxID=1907415 RepID=UPI0009D80AA4|nr:ABC transporter substrate-binding protein [Rhizobium sp. RU36D]SMC48920.1 amino acid/amide ABC transporter substrate-binding protein, HAAT family [Rhizobium sp. RU36D]
MIDMKIHRRAFLGGTAALALTSIAPLRAMAEGEAIRIGALTPLTGSGGTYGPVMVKAIQAVADEINAAGGILGRKVEIISEDDQTNPEAGVRAARKLVDVDKVSAIIGTWASSVTTAVAPICWESKTMLLTVSGADAITTLPHQGFIIRTQPTTILQGRKFGEFAVEQGVKKLFFVSPQTPFAESQFTNITSAVTAAGGETKSLIYDDKKPSYRSEVDEMMAYEPDVIVLGGYAADTTVLLKDIYRAGYEGKKIAFAYSVNQKLIDSVPAEVVEGIFTIAPSPAETSTAYKRLVGLIGVANPDPYTTQVYDQMNLVALAIAKAGNSDGVSIRDAIRLVSQGADGTAVDNALDGLKLIAEGKPVNYQGASGPCDFTDKGDITDSAFRYEQVLGGKLTLVKIA